MVVKSSTIPTNNVVAKLFKRTNRNIGIDGVIPSDLFVKNGQRIGRRTATKEKITNDVQFEGINYYSFTNTQKPEFPANAVNAWGTNNWKVRVIARVGNFTGTKAFISNGFNIVSNTKGVWFGINGSIPYIYYTSGGIELIAGITGMNVPLNTWFEVVYERISSTQLKVTLDGVSQTFTPTNLSTYSFGDATYPIWLAGDFLNNYGDIDLALIECSVNDELVFANYFEEVSQSTLYNVASNTTAIIPSYLSANWKTDRPAQYAYSHLNQKGYNLSGADYIPASLSNPDQDVLGNPLEYKGALAPRAQLKGNNNAIVLDGINEKIKLPYQPTTIKVNGVDDTLNWTITDVGSGEWTIEPNSEKTVYNLEVDDKLYPCSETGGIKLYTYPVNLANTAELQNVTLPDVHSSIDGFQQHFYEGYYLYKDASDNELQLPVDAGATVDISGTTFNRIEFKDGYKNTGQFNGACSIQFPNTPETPAEVRGATLSKNQIEATSLISVNQDINNSLNNVIITNDLISDTNVLRYFSSDHIAKLLAYKQRVLADGGQILDEKVTVEYFKFLQKYDLFSSLDWTIGVFFGNKVNDGKIEKAYSLDLNNKDNTQPDLAKRPTVNYEFNGTAVLGNQGNTGLAYDEVTWVCKLGEVKSLTGYEIIYADGSGTSSSSLKATLYRWVNGTWVISMAGSTVFGSQQVTTGDFMVASASASRGIRVWINGVLDIVNFTGIYPSLALNQHAIGALSNGGLQLFNGTIKSFSVFYKDIGDLESELRFHFNK